VPQFKQLIDAFNLFGLEYIPAIKGKLYPIHKLHHITCPNIIPPDYSKPAAMKSSDILYSIDSLEYLKNTMLSQKAEMDFPDKVYLSRRNASNRRKFNEDEVFEMLKKYGFDEVLPEDYTINEQVALFNQAKIIVTGSGAALTNVLFCSEKCRIVVLVKDELLFSGFSSLASFSNAEMIYMVSDEKSENVKKIHSSFKINVSNLEKLIKKIL
jgi:capsular polysaccharide biosynthesis protein